MLLLQTILFLAIYTGMIAFAVRGGAVNALFFYPEPVQERAFAMGLADRKDIRRKSVRFMTSFFVVLLVALLLIIGLWNRVDDFKTAYLQALLFLEVSNWYDGIVIDRLWVGHSRLWIIAGTEDIPFVKPWKEVMLKRTITSLVWLLGAAVVASLAVLIF